MMHDPIVIDPPDFDQSAAWQECRDFVERCGGLERDDGEPNMRAASGADPGICSCPACHEMYWMWGRKQRCAKCGFEYPTNAWPMYSWGVQARRCEDNPPPAFDDPHVRARIRERHEKSMGHPYYRYGYDNPAGGDICDAFKQIDWREVMRDQQTQEVR